MSANKQVGSRFPGQYPCNRVKPVRFIITTISDCHIVEPVKKTTVYTAEKKSVGNAVDFNAPLSHCSKVIMIIFLEKNNQKPDII